MGGKSDEPKQPEKPNPEAGLPKVDPQALAAEKRAAAEVQERAQRRSDRQEAPGPAARLKPELSEQLKTEGPKHGTQPPDVIEKKPSELRNDPGPQAAPDVAKPGIKYTSTPTPGGGKSWAQAKADQAELIPDKPTPGDDARGR